jgi:hypothetical protein
MNVLLGKKCNGRGSQGACRQHELIGGKPPVVSKVPFTVTVSAVQCNAVELSRVESRQLWDSCQPVRT